MDDLDRILKQIAKDADEHINGMRYSRRYAHEFVVPYETTSEVDRWLGDNIHPQDFALIPRVIEFHVFFVHDTDAVLFRLRWGEVARLTHAEAT